MSLLEKLLCQFWGQQADVITPNQFEVEQLTGISIQTVEDAQQACQALHGIGVRLVLITSIVFPQTKTESCGASTNPSESSIGIMASQRTYNNSSSSQQTADSPKDEQTSKQHSDEQFIVYTPKLAGQFTGTGDVCAALFLGFTASNDDNEPFQLACALEKLAGETFFTLLYLREDHPW